ITVHPGRDGYRLPTEAEWAAAAAAGQRIVAGTELTLVEDRTLSSIELRGVNFLRSGDRWEDPRPPYTRNGGPTSPVGSLGSGSPLGLSDLLGNVWEWTVDWYDPEWYRRIADGGVQEPWAGPREPAPDVYGRRLRTVRGTAWNTPQEEIRPGNRGGFAPDATSHSIGVRLVRTVAVGDAPLPQRTAP
ncbi:MAG: formylglycine-generating enzyme family protein, partial [Alkalispirochaeta sp.]